MKMKYFGWQIGFRGMEDLSLSKFPHLKEVLPDQFPVRFFGNLKSLEVDNDCSNLRYIFIPSIFEEFMISSCTVEEIVAKEEDVAAVPRLVFPQLTRLELSYLPSLTSFYPGLYILELPMLKKLRMWSCDKVEILISKFLSLQKSNEESQIENSIQEPFFIKNSLPCKVFRNLKTLEVLHCVNLKNLVPSFVSFQNLMTLEVSKCNRLVNLMVVSVAKSLVQLTRLKIRECEMIEEIITHVGNKVEDRIIFNQLEYLELHSLPKLTSFCSRNHTIEFPSLHQVVVRQCHNMKLFSHGPLSTPRLHRLQITEEEEGIWEGGLNTTIQKMYNSLMFLRIFKMDNLWKIWDHQIASNSFSKIVAFRIHDCHNLPNVFPLKMFGRLQKLKELVVQRCNSLGKIFEEDMISSCTVEEIVDKEDVAAVPRLVFPQLTSLQLADLPSLTSFYPGLYISEWPKLKKLMIWSCNKVELLTSEFLSLRKCLVESQLENSIQEPLFIVDKNSQPCKVFRNLKTLEVLECDNLKNLVPSSVSFQNLTTLEVSECNGLVNLMVVSVAKSLVQLTRLKITKCKMIEEIIIHDRVDEMVDQIIFTQLNYLELHSLPRLTSFCSGNHIIEFPSLKQVVVRQCLNMKIFSLGASNMEELKKQFEKLRDVRETVQNSVDEAKRQGDEIDKVVEKWMQSVDEFTNRVVKSIIDDDQVKAGKLCSISFVPNLIARYSLSRKATKTTEKGVDLLGEGTFEKVSYRPLLQKTTSISVGGYGDFDSRKSIFDNLMEALTKADVNLIGVKEETVNSAEENLQSKVQHLFDEKVRIPNLKFSRIEKMDNIRKIWHHQLTPDSFSKIDSFGIYDCHNLINIFPSNMIGKLQKLEVLTVSNCKSVEVIFEELDTSSCMVEEIVAKEDDVKAVPKLVFPRLTSLGLVDLPRLSVLYPGLYISQLPMLKTLRIWGCKKVEKLTSEFQSLQENHGESQHKKFSIVDKVRALKALFII
ncbi:hypothetical protein Dsin_007503, partial [Dipteronia sinensis]